MKYSCYQDYFVILGWLVYWVFGCEMRRLTKSHRKSSFSKISYSWHFALLDGPGCVRGLENLKQLWPYLMDFTSCISTGKLE